MTRSCHLTLCEMAIHTIDTKLGRSWVGYYTNAPIS